MSKTAREKLADTPLIGFDRAPRTPRAMVGTRPAEIAPRAMVGNRIPEIARAPRAMVGKVVAE